MTCCQHDCLDDATVIVQMNFGDGWSQMNLCDEHYRCVRRALDEKRKPAEVPLREWRIADDCDSGG